MRDTMTPAPAGLSIPDLRAAIHGSVIAPGDAGYDDARKVMMGGIDRRPSVIVKVADPEDVAHVIELARETGLELAVRSGGHSASGHSTTDGGIVLDVSQLKDLEVDVADRSAWAGAGLTAREFTTGTWAYELATGFGDTGSVGIGGITLGGGIGYLVRGFGLTIDSLLAAEIVTADGQLRRVDAEHEPDLFWALRGGGGNFGVVTRFRYRLHALGGFTGGLLILPATADTVTGFIAAADAAPEGLSTIANVMPCPPMPFVPADRHGTVMIFALMAFAGDDAAGAAAVAPFRGLAEPLADMVRPIPYPEIYPPDDDDYHPLAISRTMFMDHIDRGVAAMIMERLEASDASVRVAQIRVLGGAMARVPADATAFAHRASRILVNVASFYEGPGDREARTTWVTDFVRALEQDDHGAYVNFIADEGEARIHAAYPGTTWDRLAAIKARYDPDNLFRLNQNVPPATGAHLP